MHYLRGMNDTFNIFDVLIWGGAALSVIGLCGLVWCILRVQAARRASLSDDAMRAVLSKVLPLNFGALGLSVLGLMLVVVGISLG